MIINTYKGIHIYYDDKTGDYIVDNIKFPCEKEAIEYIDEQY